jgi:3-deoxy-D-manno-octulosonic-acid transferase
MAMQVPGLRLVLVPRHVERTARIGEELRAMNVAAVTRSTVDTTPLVPASVLLVDTTGELRAWQHLATVVIIGKSFLTTGGQNPAEAAMAGKPVVFGPHMENFDALVRVLLARRGAVQVADFAGLEDALRGLFQDPVLARKTAEAGREALKSHEGSTRRTVAHLLAGNTSKQASHAS